MTIAAAFSAAALALPSGAVLAENQSAETRAAETRATETRVATWNIANFHDRLGEALRDGSAVRKAEDIARLRLMERAVAADVYALQEINGPAAARLIFDETTFELCVSSRYEADLARGYTVPDAAGERRTDRIYTMVAVRRGRFDRVECRAVDSLSMEHEEPGEPARETRRGVAAVLTRGDAELTVLSVHMKASCNRSALGALDGVHERPDCRTFERMAAALEAWADAETLAGRALVIAGDFNRQINRHHGGDPDERRDHFFGALNDGDPPGVAYWAFPEKVAAGPPPRACFRGRPEEGPGGYRPQPVDFILANAAAARLARPETLEEFDYRTVLGKDYDAARYAGRDQERLSDHCPLAVTFAF